MQLAGLESFLQRNNIPILDLNYLVHSTKSYNLKFIMRDNSLRITACDVFKCDLNYFFLGRPSYKTRDSSGQACKWELPCCFILDFNAIKSIHKIYPFDTGSYYTNRMPSYINTIPMNEFEIPPDIQSAQRIVGSIFSSAEDYYNLKNTVSEEDLHSKYALSPFEVEILAIRNLADAKFTNLVDDRRFAIEVSSKDNVTLMPKSVLAVVAPSLYFDDITFLNKVEHEWQAQPIPYTPLPITSEQHIYEIYNKVQTFYKQIGAF